MAKIFFFCIPAHGHTNPTLGVVKELVRRGHAVRYYSYDALREKIESTGATFVSCDKYDAEQHLTPKDGARIGKDLAFSTEILVNTTLALDQKIEKDIAEIPPDVIVADSMALWGKLAARKYGIPFVSSTTTFAFNKESAKIMKQSFGDLVKMIFSMPKIAKQIDRLKQKGFPVTSVLDIIQNDNDTHTVVYTSKAFQPMSETFSKKYAFVGPSVRPAKENIDKTHDKLVYISMGTVNNDLFPFYKSCIKAFQTTDYQVILSTGSQVDINRFGNLPANVSVYPTVDQIAVLQKADVFVTHCGMNSVSEALYYGVPLVMLPKTPEQSGVAERAKQLGAGVLLEKETPGAIYEAVSQVFNEKTYQENAQKIMNSFRACTGAVGAADKILEVCKA